MRLPTSGARRGYTKRSRRRLVQIPSTQRVEASPTPCKTAGLSVISEIKRRSPSKGDLFADLDPAALAVEYEGGGAAALSVLTDKSTSVDRRSISFRPAPLSSLPVLRKDFTVDRRDVLDARLMGADCVLLIVGCARPTIELAEFTVLAADLGLDALVETHDEREIERASGMGATLIGVNQRDLVTFEVDTDRAVRVRWAIPDEVVAVAESGVRGPSDAAGTRCGRLRRRPRG